MKSVTAPTSTTVLMIVSHSHWDREWHLPFQQFRIKLGKMIDSLLNILASDPGFSCFMLDGQTILLEDYAELRPERAEELRARISSGRILVGPWYVLPDEFLVSGEAIIRNLFVGRDIAKRFGGYMGVGYLPDQFGHIAQMPQILASFGIRSAVLWRGVDDDVLEATEFTWRAPDGSGVLAINIPDGYFNAGGLPSDADELTVRIRLIVDRLIPKGNTQYLLLMNGGDHVWPQPALPHIMSTLRSRLPEVEVRHSSLSDYVDAVERSLTEKGVQTEIITGELRRCKRSHLLPGVLSTRMWIKQRNAACENLLEKWAEPFTAWAWIESTTRPKTGNNGAVPASLPDTSLPRGQNWRMPLQMAWKYLLQNQPHDSICGCSVDEVHQEMQVRYDWVEQIGETLVEEALQELSERVDTASFAAGKSAELSHSACEAQESSYLVVYNPLTTPRTDLATFEADTDSELQAIDDKGDISPCQMLEDLGNGKSKFGFVATDIPGIGYKTYRIQARFQPAGTATPAGLDAARASTADRAPGAVGSRNGDSELRGRAQIENEFYVVVANEADGTIDVVDRTTGRVYRGLLRFSDVGDAGDEYNFDNPTEDDPAIRPASPAEVALVENGPARLALEIRSVLRIPKELGPDRRSRSAEKIDCPLATTVRLHPGVRRIDISTRVENLAKDHRLRVEFPTEIRANEFYTETQFDVLRREVCVPTPRPEWAEDPVAAQPQKSFVDVNDGEHGLSIANRGLPECEVSPETEGLMASVTLLRCVEWLSRADLRSRRGNAGPELRTPGAQCLGTQRFDYAIAPHEGGWQNGWLQAHQFNHPLRATPTGQHAGHLPARLSFVTVTPEWVPASAVKPSHDARGLVVRLYNPTSDTIEARLTSYLPFRKAELVDSKEERIEDIPGISDGLRVTLAPKRLATVKVYFRELAQPGK